MNLTNMKQLLQELTNIEEKYKKQKFKNKMRKNEILLFTDWEKINQDRKNEGLSKLTNQDMKIAYVEYQLEKDLEKETELELEYNLLKKEYEISMKYSLEVLK